MNLRLRDRATAAADGASAGLAGLFTAMTIFVFVGTGLFIIALGVALGVGFGVGGRTHFTRSVTLAPPIFSCDASASCGCGPDAPVFTSRIINGQTAVQNSWPWMAYLTNPTSPRTFCTGFVITERHVLTSTQCVAQYGFNVTVSVGVRNFQSLWGAINASNATTITSLPNGISVVTLMTNLSFTGSTIKPCCLTRTSMQPLEGTNGVIAGWGETSANALNIPPRNLQQAVVQVVNPNICGGTSNSNDNSTICARFGNVATCPMDAGGPLMINLNNKWTCVGVIARSASCQTPISFIRISPFIDMINNITGIYNLPFQKK